MFISGLFIGFLLGFILQRGQFCLSAQLRNIIFKPSIISVSPLLLAITIQAIGFFILQQYHLIKIPSSPMPIMATIIGGLLFGIGMGVGQRCITGQLYRSAEGLISAWITLLVFAITMATTQTGILKFWLATQLESKKNSLVTLPQTFAISPIYFIATLTIITAYCCYKSYRIKPFIIFPKQPLKQYWSPYFTAILLAIVSLLAWLLSARTGREFGLSFSIPLANTMQYLVMGQQRYLNWGTYLILGVLFGSLVSAWLSKTLVWKSLNPINCIKSIIAGILMAIGAALAGGCTMANTVVATAYFSWQGWLATLMMMLGLYIFTKVRQKIIAIKF